MSALFMKIYPSHNLLVVKSASRFEKLRTRICSLFFIVATTLIISPTKKPTQRMCIIPMLNVATCFFWLCRKLILLCFLFLDLSIVL